VLPIGTPILYDPKLCLQARDGEGFCIGGLRLCRQLRLGKGGNVHLRADFLARHRSTSLAFVFGFKAALFLIGRRSTSSVSPFFLTCLGGKETFLGVWLPKVPSEKSV
jgi:hypothetical protein